MWIYYPIAPSNGPATSRLKASWQSIEVDVCVCVCVCERESVSVCMSVLRSVRVGSSHTLGGNTDVSVSRLLRDSFQFRLMMQELHKFSAIEKGRRRTERGYAMSL